MLVIVKEKYEEVSKEAAKLIAAKIRKKPDLVLGLATGSSPLGIYKELIRMHIEEGLDFSKITTFNLDEYIGLPPTHNQSYHYFMKQNLFDHINVDERFVHVPHGMAKDIDRIKISHSDAYKYSFYCRTVRLWNALPSNVIDSSSQDTFKSGVVTWITPLSWGKVQNNWLVRKECLCCGM